MKYTYYMYFFLLIFKFIYCCSFIKLPRGFKNNYKQHYLKEKFTPVFEEKTIHLKHNESLFSKIRNIESCCIVVYPSKNLETYISKIIDPYLFLFLII